MDPETATYIASIQPTDEDLEAYVDQVRYWEHGYLEAAPYGMCALAWPRVRIMALEELRQQLADPLADVEENQFPLVGLHLAAVNNDSAFTAPLLEALKLDGDAQDVLFGDLLLDTGSALLALTAKGNKDAIHAVEESLHQMPEQTPIGNTLPLEALALLVADGAYERERFDRIARRILQELEDPRLDEDARQRRSWVGSVLMDLGPGDLADDIRSLFKQDKMEGPPFAIFDEENFEEAIEKQQGGMDPEWHAWKRYQLIQADTYESINWTVDVDADDDEPSILEAEAWEDPMVLVPEVRATPKVGRNEPCPCGSGKKYKKCCGAN